MNKRSLEEIQFALAYKDIIKGDGIYGMDMARVTQLNARLIQQIKAENDALEKQAKMRGTR